ASRPRSCSSSSSTRCCTRSGSGASRCVKAGVCRCASSSARHRSRRPGPRPRALAPPPSNAPCRRLWLPLRAVRITDARTMAPGALDGIRVLDFGELVSAPYCAKLFADYGADVVKVEPPGGDSARTWGPFPGDAPHLETSGLFFFLNTNKRGVTL